MQGATHHPKMVIVAVMDRRAGAGNLTLIGPDRDGWRGLLQHYLEAEAARPSLTRRGIKFVLRVARVIVFCPALVRDVGKAAPDCRRTGR